MGNNYQSMSWEYMLSDSGSLRKVYEYEIADKKAAGWHIIKNPTPGKTYWSEFDLRNGGSPMPEQLMDDLSEDEALVGEYV